MSIPENPLQAKVLFQLLRELEQRAGVVAKPFVNSGPIIGHRPDNTWIVTDDVAYWVIVAPDSNIGSSGHATAFRLELFRARREDPNIDYLQAPHVYVGTWRFPPHLNKPSRAGIHEWLDQFWHQVANPNNDW